MKKIIIFTALTFCTPLFMDAQCAMCRAVVESGGKEIARGINSGILYLMAIPYILVAIGGFFIYKNIKKN